MSSKAKSLPTKAGNVKSQRISNNNAALPGNAKQGTKRTADELDDAGWVASNKKAKSILDKIKEPAKVEIKEEDQHFRKLGTTREKVEEELRKKRTAEVLQEVALLDEMEGDEDSEEEEGEQVLSKDVQARLDCMDGLVSSLSKQFLKDIMKTIGVYGGGTNKVMAGCIMGYLEQLAAGGADLAYESRVVKRVHRECWGGCGDESEGEEEDSDY